LPMIEVSQEFSSPPEGFSGPLCQTFSPMTTVQGRMVHEVTKPLRT
jgi:hypothetical protein